MTFVVRLQYIREINVTPRRKAVFTTRTLIQHMLIPVATPSKAWVYSHSLAGVAGSNPALSIDICLLWVLGVVRVEESVSGWSLVQRSPTSMFEFNLRISTMRRIMLEWYTLALSDPTSDLVRQYDFPVPLRCRKTSDTIFVAFVCPLSEPVRRCSSCSTDFSQQIAQVVLFLFLYVFLF
jgi:hypothetical protein